MRIFIFFILSPFFALSVSYTWNGVTSSAWGTNTNWTPNGIPGAGDNVTIVAVANNPLYNGVAGVTNITMTSGTLNLNGFSLTCSGTAVFNGGAITNGTINPTGTTATFAGSTFGAVVIANCGNINLNGSVFNSTVTLTKTNTTNNAGSGGNTFNAVTTLNENGTGYLRTGSTNPDIFNADLNVNVSTNGDVYLAQSSTGTQFNGNVILTNTSGGDIHFGNGGGTSSIANAKTVSLGSGGFSGGSVRFTNFTQADPLTPLSMTTFTGNATTVYFLTGNSFAGNVSIKAGSIYFDGSTFTANTSFTKTGTAQDDTDGGNNFLGASNVFICQAGADRWRMANVNPDVFNNATFTHDGSSNFIVARQTMGNIFNGTTTFNSNTSGGVYISRSNTSSNSSSTFNGPVIINVQLSGNVTFSEGSGTINNSTTFNNSIQINSSSNSTGDIIFGQSNSNNSTTLNNGAGFIAGTVLGATQVTIRNLTQIGGTAQNITMGGTGILNLGMNGYGNTFNGSCTFSVPTINFGTSVFNADCSATSSTQLTILTSTFSGTSNYFNKGGGTNSTTSGGNTFGATSSNTFVNSGTGQFRFGGASDLFNGHARYIQNSGAGVLEPAYSNFSTYKNNISTVGTSVTVNFGVGGGGVITSGTGVQTVDGSASFPPLFYNLTTSHTGTLSLSVPATIRNTFAMNSGVIALNSNVLTLGISTAVKGTLTYAGGLIMRGQFQRWFSTTSFAVGTDAGLFPMGNTNLDYRPLWLGYSVNLSAGGTIGVIHDYLNSPPTFTSSHNDASWGNTVVAVTSSSWVVSSANSFNFNGSTGMVRFGGTGFGSNVLSDLNASFLSSVIGTHGAATNVNTTIEANRTALSTANVNNAWRIGTRNLSASPLPIELIYFGARKFENKVLLEWSTATEKNNKYFTVQKSQDGLGFADVWRINGRGSSAVKRDYSAQDEKPFKGISYYRLQTTAFDGELSYSRLCSVDFGNQDQLRLTYDFDLGAVLTGIEGSALVNIYDFSGKQLVSQSTNTSSLALTKERFQQLHPGVYVLVVSQGSEMLREKFVVH